METCKTKKLGVAALWLLLCLGHGVGVVAQSHSEHRSSSKPSRPESLTLELIDQVEEQLDAVRGSGETVDLGPGLARGQGEDLWSSVLQITRLDNPFVTEQCRREAVITATSIIGGVEDAKIHAGTHNEEWKEVLRGERRISLTEYLDHIVKCTEFCAPYVGSLLKCHVQGVQKASGGDSLVLTFGVGIPRRDDGFEFPRVAIRIPTNRRSRPKPSAFKT